MLHDLLMSSYKLIIIKKKEEGYRASITRRVCIRRFRAVASENSFRLFFFISYFLKCNWINLFFCQEIRDFINSNQWEFWHNFNNMTIILWQNMLLLVKRVLFSPLRMLVYGMPNSINEYIKIEKKYCYWVV